MAENAVRPANNEGAKFVERVENIEAEKASEKGTYMAKCKAFNEDIGTVYDDAKTAGFTKSSMRAVVKARKLDAKAKAAREDLDLADRDTFDAVRHALGDLAELPLGQAAMDQAANGGAQAQASA